MGAKINCSICGKPVDSDMENCPHCGSPVKVGRPIVPVTPSPPLVASGAQCPSCGAAVQDGDIVCVRCGVNLLTGQQVVKKDAAASGPAVRSNTPMLLLGLAAAVLLVVGGVALFMFLRDPVNEARTMARSGDLLGATGLLQKHTASFPDDAQAFALLGRLQLQTQQYPDAASSFDTASSLRPSDKELGYLAVLAAGRIPGETGMQRQIAALQRLVEHHPDDQRALRMLALAQGATGAEEASGRTLEQLSSAGGDPGEVATYRGVTSALRGDFASAHGALDGAPPDSADAQLARGYLAGLEGETMKAAARLDAVVSAGGPVDSEARTRLGLLQMAQGNFDQALPLLRPVDAGRPSDGARFFYGLCLQTAGLEDEALQEYERLVSGESRYAEDAAIQMAIIYLKRDQVDRAAESTRQGRKFGSSARLFTVEGQVAARQGDESAAQDLFRKALQADPDYPAAHLESGLTYIRRGVLSEGVRSLRRYLELVEGGVPGGRINEVDLLVKQLEQAASPGGARS
ncbi:MAG: tetratricopeptide repeat protein [Candidatus Hydrogenedentes bacterium]|nr:tetratricopeptide repeat protein [Candidatus Hydrogenedentota bacterium]